MNGVLLDLGLLLLACGKACLGAVRRLRDGKWMGKAPW